jgi:hypothetical protein
MGARRGLSCLKIRYLVGQCTNDFKIKMQLLSIRGYEKNKH